jgi:hypothetical protein
MQILWEGLCYACHSPKPVNLIVVVLIAIRFEGINTSPNEFAMRSNCPAGLAIVDTREIGSVPLDKLVKTYHFATGTSRTSKECTRNSCLMTQSTLLY